jgi:hypothetical protein
MNTINKTAGMAGFLYFIYGVIHISADASQQKTAGVKGAESGHELLKAVFLREIAWEGDADENNITGSNQDPSKEEESN